MTIDISKDKKIPLKYAIVVCYAYPSEKPFDKLSSAIYAGNSKFEVLKKFFNLKIGRNFSAVNGFNIKKECAEYNNSVKYFNNYSINPAYLNSGRFIVSVGAKKITNKDIKLFVKKLTSSKLKKYKNNLFKQIYKMNKEGA